MNVSHISQMSMHYKSVSSVVRCRLFKMERQTFVATTNANVLLMNKVKHSRFLYLQVSN